MRDGQYVVIQAFMLSDLHLKGNELIVYATIYGYTQDGCHWFYGTKGYLSEWCGASKGTVGNCLRSLVEKGYLERRETSEQGQVRIEYRATKFVTPPNKNCNTPHTIFGHINNLEEQPNKDNRKKGRNPATFDSIIGEFTQDEGLRSALREFLKYRRASKKPLTNQALRLNLTKLSKLASEPDAMTAIVNQTIERGWTGFFPLKDDASRLQTDRRTMYTDEQNAEFDAYAWTPDRITYAEG